MENNEVRDKLRANHFLILITFLCTAKQNSDQRCYERMESGMAGRKNWNKQIR